MGVNKRLVLLTVLAVIGLTTGGTYHDNKDPESNAEAHGNVYTEFKPASGLSSWSSPQKANVSELWCTARQKGVLLSIDHATFWRDSDRQSFAAELYDRDFVPKSRAVLKLNDWPITGVGKYRCDIFTKHNASQYTCSGMTFINLRPVFMVNNTNGYTVAADDVFFVTAPKKTVSKGDTAFLDCPFFSFPNSSFVWFKKVVNASEEVKMSNRTFWESNGTLVIANVSAEDTGVYYCKVTNSYKPSASVTNDITYTATLEQSLDLKSPYGWVLPLIIIAIMALLLFIIIFGCGIIKRCRSYNVEKRERRQVKKGTETTSSGNEYVQEQRAMLSHDKREVDE